MANDILSETISRSDSALPGFCRYLARFMVKNAADIFLIAIFCNNGLSFLVPLFGVDGEMQVTGTIDKIGWCLALFCFAMKKVVR
jgi:hypothetical protein